MSPDENIELKVDPKVEEAERVAQKTHRSKGEKLFDLLTYSGIAGIGTFILTIPIAYWAKYGGGAKGFVKASKFLQKTGMSEHTVEQIMITNATMQGGNVTIIPVKMMEDNKRGLVEKFNNMLGDKSGDASIDNEPEQTWGSIIKGRIFAWVAVYSGFMGASAAFGGEKFRKFEEKFAEHVVCAPLGKATHTPGMAKIVANETKAFRYGRIAALDVFGSTAATILLYVGSKFFARNNQRWHAQDLPKDAENTKQNDLSETAPDDKKLIAVPEATQTSQTLPKRQIKDNGWAESITSQKVVADNPQHTL